jgi:uncharacterized protein YyaL (SSP411 family)
MAFVQVTTGAGGWPMSVWLTPDLKPFFGGTYFPPTSRWGRPGFIEVLAEIGRSWREDRDRIVQSASTIVERLQDVAGSNGAGPAASAIAGREAIDAGVGAFAQAYDPRHGGFGGAPKFPRPSELLFLLQGHAFTGDAGARRMAVDTLRAMSLGGMRDHVGGGFHRYSVDAEWRVPHFEKMLYDQAQLVIASLEAQQVTGESYYGVVAEDTLDYVRHDLTGPDGAFLSAEDADSLPAGSAADAHGEKLEGAFYVWTTAEIDQLFGADAPVVRRRFGMEESGNALADPQGEFRGQNILYVAQSVEDIVARTDRSIDDVMAVLARARQVLYEARKVRPRPHLDDKVITAWNGLMIAAFARAGRVLVDSPRRTEWRDAAVRAAEAIRSRLWQPDRRRLLRIYRDGQAAVDGFCEDYAYLGWGLTELFEGTGDGRWLDWALELTAVQAELFFDESDGGWFSTTGEDPSVLMRLKEDYDGAEPAAGSIAVRNLLTLGRLTGDRTLIDRAGRTLERYGSEIGRVARVMPFMVSNVARWHAGPTEIVLVDGDAGADGFDALDAALGRRYLPWAVQVPVRSPEQRATLARLPWIQVMTARDGKAAAYVCRDFACQAPVADAEALDSALQSVAGPRRIVG